MGGKVTLSEMNRRIIKMCCRQVCELPLKRVSKGALSDMQKAIVQVQGA